MYLQFNKSEPEMDTVSRSSSDRDNLNANVGASDSATNNFSPSVVEMRRYGSEGFIAMA
jgi:hypothetical protein